MKPGSHAQFATATRSLDWISRTFVVDRVQLTNIVALHLDFGIMLQKSLGNLIDPNRRAMLKDFQVDANKRAVLFLNLVAAKYANPKLQVLTTKYFVYNNSLRGYVKPEAGGLSYHRNY